MKKLIDKWQIPTAKLNLKNFRYRPGGSTSLVDALCSFIKEEIAFGRIKGGERFPTISEIGKTTGLTFAQARRVTECLAKEGYVNSRPHVGTVVTSRSNNVLRGRVLVIYPDVDICRFYPAQLFDTVNRKLTKAGYAVAVSSFPLGEKDGLAQLKSELVRATDLVIALRATPNVQRCLAKSGVNHIFAYGDKPVVEDGSPWIEFSSKKATSLFVDHCVKAGVRRVLQVVYEDNEEFDAGVALAESGIYCSRLTIRRPEPGRGRFDGIVNSACEVFEAMPRNDMPDLLLFWNAFAAQGAMMALLHRGIRIPEDIKVASISHVGFGPVYVKSVTRFESDPLVAGEQIADFALAVLARGRIPPPPRIDPQYVFGATFPFEVSS